MFALLVKATQGKERKTKNKKNKKIEEETRSKKKKTNIHKRVLIY